MIVDLSRITRIYTALQDEESRFLFEKRILYNLTGEIKHLADIVFETDDRWKALLEFCKQIKDGLVLYGCGIYGKILSSKIPFDYAIDKSAKSLDNISVKVISPNNFIKKYNSEYVVIGISPYTKSIQDVYDFLIKNGIKTDKIISLKEDKKGYFILSPLKMRENEVFVDAGVFDGYDSIDFSNKTEGNYKHIYAFEPDSYSYNISNILFANNDIQKITVENIGLWEKTARLYFTNDGTDGSRVIESANSIIDVTSIDDYFLAQKSSAEFIPTIIKMDIEGSEFSALLGAERLITLYKPKLIISIYHRIEDIFEIPNLILNYNSHYKFYLRRLNISPINDYVLYAM